MYCAQVAFVTETVLHKTKEKGRHDKSFSEDNIAKIFCNIEELHHLHKSLLQDLLNEIEGGITHLSQIATVYAKYVDGFQVYTKYGSNNKEAQKAVLELEKDPVVKAFFTACMLLGGHGNEALDAFLFKPVQRVCKYPLLFKELLKYTPEDHQEFDSTLRMLKGMKDVCSVVNETKRRVEKLEAIADWQATVEGWEGSNVTSTCNELMKKGPLIKISAGNTQEREFFLFDNLLVYCKKTGVLSLKGRKEKSPAKAVHQLLFKGRIPLESLEIEDVEDGRSDYHTNGITVTNGWKCRNSVKNKWFVLIAKTPQDKKDWLDAIRALKDKRKRQAAGIAQDTEGLMRDKGQTLYKTMKREEKPLIKDRRYHLRTYQKSFVGSEFVHWLIQTGEAANVEEAVRLGQALLESGIIHHVCDDHQFKNELLFYRFRYDDGTYRHKHQLQDLHSKGLRLYLNLQGLYTPKIKDHKQAFGSLKNVLSGAKLVDSMVNSGLVTTRQEGELLAQDLFGQGVIRHISDEHKFKDVSGLYFRFTADDGVDMGDKKKASGPKLVAMKRLREFIVRSILVPWTSNGFGLTIAKGKMSVIVKTVQDGSPAQGLGVAPLHSVVAIGNHFIPIGGLLDGDLQMMLDYYFNSRCPLHLVLLQTPQFYVTVVPNEAGSMGIHVKGSNPPVIGKVDPKSPAAAQGVVSGCALLHVNECDVSTKNHEEVVEVVRREVVSSKDKGVTFKLGVSDTQHIHHYSMDTPEGSKDVYMTMEEAPLNFVTPTKFLQVQSSYYQYTVDLLKPVLSALKSSDVKACLSSYVEHLDALRVEYSKTASRLSTYHSTHWPAFKASSLQVTDELRACPTNCHLHKMTVLANMEHSEPGSPTSVDADSGSGNPKPHPLLFRDVEASYPFVTMAIPSKEEAHLNLSLRKMEEIQSLRRAEAMIRLRYHQLCGEKNIIGQFTHRSIYIESDGDDQSVSSMDLSGSDDFSESQVRGRLESVNDISPVMNLIKEGIQTKVNAFVQSCDNAIVERGFEQTKHVVHDGYQDSVTILKRIVHKEMAEFASAAKVFSDKLSSAVEKLAKALDNMCKMFCFRLTLAVALTEDPAFLVAQDMAFSQLLSGVLSSFMAQLELAEEYKYNPETQYCENKKGSEQWLAQIAHIGLLVMIEAPMSGVKGEDVPKLEALRKTLKLIQTVEIVIEPLSSDLEGEVQHPIVTLKGNRSMLHVVVNLPHRLFHTLPERLVSVDSIHIVPVMFTHSLSSSCPEYDLTVLQRSINEKSLQVLKEYYRQMRMYRLNKDHLPHDPVEQQAAIHQISQPLNSLDILMNQVEHMLDHIYTDGVGILSLTSEAAVRMGGVRITSCDSGVYRSLMSLTLEEAALLVRCHGLPMKGFRTVLNTLREGTLSLLEKKNNVNIKVSFPTVPPRLYRVRLTGDKTDDETG